MFVLTVMMAVIDSGGVGGCEFCDGEIGRC